MQAHAPKPARRPGVTVVRVLVALGYPALFLWQLAVASGMGREAGLMVYALWALIPVLIAGAPWTLILCVCLPSRTAGSSPDYTVFSAYTLLYHSFILASFAVNGVLIFKQCDWYEREGYRGGRPPA